MQDGQLKVALKGVRDTAEDAVTRVTGLPPRRIRAGISPLWFDFKDTGADQLEFFTELCGLRPSHRVLDIGCGVGRIAIPLTRYLDSEGSYDGFDIAPAMISWCEEHISSEHPNFRFHLAHVNSSITGLNGGGKDSEYRFPFDDDEFDFVYAGSLFTHLTPAGAENYLREAARTLKPGGRVVSTFNLFNRASEQLVASRRLQQYWPNDFGHYRTKEKDAPESNVSYDEEYVRRVHAEAGLRIVEPLRPDASYSPIRAPKRVGDGAANLWYSTSVIAVKR
jgi:ubiquinone/menaquinone biosynthesis C-methylase UbiE